VSSGKRCGEDVDSDAAVIDPLDLLDAWLAPVAACQAPVDATSVPLMALATVDSEGRPHVRHVLLSGYDRGRLHFHSDANSAKAAHLRLCPQAAATLFWPDTLRQLSLRGPVTVQSGEQARRHFARRSRTLQQLAWLNDARFAALGEAERLARWQSFGEAHPHLEPPPTWIGYTLEVEQLSFWCGAPDRPSTRLLAERGRDGWQLRRCPG
jgi:pyridoxamine 5'-phosphate oxidase